MVKINALLKSFGCADGMIVEPENCVMRKSIKSLM
jgi:hypothetical protein